LARNHLFVGNEDAGNNVAGLCSLVATCEAKGVNPLDYLSDVLWERQSWGGPAVGETPLSQAMMGRD
jgi:transposase